MKKIIICAAALTLGLAAVSTADARVHHHRLSANAETARLNQEQLAQNQEAQPSPAAQPQGVAPDSTDMAAIQPEAQTMVVAAPAHDAEETVKQPDTSPPSTGTPSIDTPYVTATPASYHPASGQ